MTLSKERLREHMLKNKEFLNELYVSDVLVSKKILRSADDSKLNTLIKYLHFLANGEIKMRKQDFEIVLKNQKLKLLKKTIESKRGTLNFLKEDRMKKLSFLLKLAPLYAHLLHSIFNKI